MKNPTRTEEHYSQWLSLDDAKETCHKFELELNELQQRLIERTAAYEKREVEFLTKIRELEDHLDGEGIHTHSDSCQRASCVLRRELKAAKERIRELEEIIQNKAWDWYYKQKK